MLFQNLFKQWRVGMISFLVLFLVFFVVLSFRLFPPGTVEGQTTERKLSGYIWSSNIGWISASGDRYGLVLSTDNKFRNYAWSSNIGWIRFFKVDGETPPGGGESGVSLSGNGVIGWARACSVFADECKGVLKDNSVRGGWDGWIRMDPMQNPAYDVQLAGNKLEGFAWGSTNLGWIDFCPNKNNPGLGDTACLMVDAITVMCDTEPKSSAVLPTDGSGANISWLVTTPGSFGDYYYEWSWSGEPVGTNPPGNDSGSSVSKTYLQTGQPEGTVVVKQHDENGETLGSDTCSIQITNNNRTLQVSVFGTGMGKVDATTPPSPIDGSISACTKTGGDCSATYADSDEVTLTATLGVGQCEDQANPGNFVNCRFDGWGGTIPISCEGTPSSCEVSMDGNKTVTAIFNNPTILTQPVSLSINPNVLEIDSHSPGQLAETQLATISAIIDGGGDQSLLVGAKVCIDSFKSASFVSPPNSPINGIIDGVGGSFVDYPRCIWGNNSEMRACVDDIAGPSCGILNAQRQVRFKIHMPTRLSTIPSDYLVNAVVSDDAGLLTGNFDISFVYGVGGGGP